MKLYQSVGPNPRVVLFYLAEKGVEIDRVFVDIMGGENRQGEWLKKHPRGGIPVLELDDGSLISEATVICDYLDERFPEKPLVGATPEHARVVRDGHTITGGGVTAGIDFALTVAAEIAGAEAAQTIQLAIEYDPAPPFDSGSPERAPASVREATTARYAKRQEAFKTALLAATRP